MTNLFWPVYKNLEIETINLMYSIHIDDNQLNVYSSRISDLIIRSVVEIESLSKTLFAREGGTGKNVKFDYEALVYLDKLWNLTSKAVIISNIQCYQSERILAPFLLDTKTSNNKLNYSWNVAYQALKHDRINSIPYGNLKSLFNSMAALFLLNVYFKTEHFELGNNVNGTTFDSSLGSDIFSIKLHKHPGFNISGDYRKNADFDECTYLLKATEDTSDKIVELLKGLNDLALEQKRSLILRVTKAESAKGNRNPALIKRILEDKIREYDSNKLVENLKRNPHDVMKAFNAVQYQAVLNINDL